MIIQSKKNPEYHMTWYEYDDIRQFQENQNKIREG
jgi:hypothetical protein